MQLSFCETLVAVFHKVSEVMSIILLLRPPNSKKITSTGLEIPNAHQCTDTRDGNYTCTGSMNGEYLQFCSHYTPLHRDRWKKLHMYRVDEWRVRRVLPPLYHMYRIHEWWVLSVMGAFHKIPEWWVFLVLHPLHTNIETPDLWVVSPTSTIHQV